MRRIIRGAGSTRAAALLLGTALMHTAPLAAQEVAQPPSAQEDEIVVEGQRDRESVINNYVRGLTAASPNEPLARYAAGDYCPAAYGLGPSGNKQIAARMRAVAAAAGVRPAEEDCVPSALVIFTEDKNAFIEKFRARHPRYFLQLRGSGRGLAEMQGPAVAWRIVEQFPTKTPTAGGLLFSEVTPVVAMSVLVLERSGLRGLTTTQLADYALMRTLTDQEPRALNVPHDFTILRAVSAPMGSAVPSSLTRWDLAYLKGRYTGGPARYSTRQAASIRSMMQRALTENRE
jgi:hypothetical protein